MQSNDLLVGKGSPEVAPVAPEQCNPMICWLAKVAVRQVASVAPEPEHGMPRIFARQGSPEPAPAAPEL